MAGEQNVNTPEVEKSKKGLTLALVGLFLAVALFAAAFVVLDGAQFVADLMAEYEITWDGILGDLMELVGVDSEPSDTAEPDASTETTETAHSTDDSETATTTATGPPSEALSRMFFEQVNSREQIIRLVEGDVSRISLGNVSNDGTTASIGVSATYKSGGSLSGTMVLRNYEGVWYFHSISGSGGSGTVAETVPADIAVTSTIVEQTMSNQDIPVAIIEGGYTTCIVNRVSAGSGTATIGIALTGGTSDRVSGEILCISKVIGGTKYWFITSFRRS